MRIKVTRENIDAFNLVTITGTSEKDLLARAMFEEMHGGEFYVQIPDKLGGDTEAPVERNTFAHFDELPEPDGRSHDQKAQSIEGNTPLYAQGSLKMLREELCRSQAAIHLYANGALVDCSTTVKALQSLIDQIDSYRPLGPDGTHDQLHTPWCGCVDQAGELHEG